MKHNRFSMHIHFMKPITATTLLIFLTLFFIMPMVLANEIGEEESDIVRAKIGIQVQSQNKVFRARARERLRAGDLIRLYVHPEKSCFVYIVHSDGNLVNLLNMTHQEVQSATLILPSAQAFFEFDGKSAMEGLTIICSPQKLDELSTLATKGLAHDQWLIVENKLLEQSKRLVTDEDHQSFAIAGNVRGLDGAVKGEKPLNATALNNDAFLKELQIFSGKGLLIKTYAFKIQK